MRKEIIWCICVVWLSLFGSDLVSARNDSKLLSFKKVRQADFSFVDFDIICDTADFQVVWKSAGILASDVEKVIDYKPAVSDKSTKEKILLMGTLGHNKKIDHLVSMGKLDVSGIRNGWEQFIIKRIDAPWPGVTQALVIAGSDRRGTAYGAMTLSEQMGVSAWEWWADVPVRKQKNLAVTVDYVSKKPSVKYRGIFINDEDWGIKPWSSKTYEKNLGDIGPKTYARVCELLLRLKGNMLAPAMHSCTGPFYKYDQNKKVADEYGIIITTSHCEPLLFNNASSWEWNKQRDGEWDYRKNKAVIYKKMDDRVREAAPYENIYTIAMRGVHDEGLKGNLSAEERVDILSEVIKDQRCILEENLKCSSEEVPQIFVPYKETLAIYEDGLQIPEDVMLVWPDDNYGYMKRLSSPDEQKRKGGSGVYYHTSYLGAPHDYLWLCTTPPVLMYEELKKAYDTGADRYWLLNVGDIKPAELDIQTFMEMAWDLDRFDYASVNRHQSRYLADIYGEEYEKAFQTILDEYYRLAWSRKPEFMGWERQWDAPQYKELSDTEFSFQNYNEALQRLTDYKAISDLSNKIYQELPLPYRASFFEMVCYPVMASYQMNRKFLMAQYNHEQIKAGCISFANWAAKESKAAYDSINSLTDTYNTLLDGKWKYMMSISMGWAAKHDRMPEVTYTENVKVEEPDLSVKEQNNVLEGCMVLDLVDYEKYKAGSNLDIRLIEGIGYDWKALQLGEAVQEQCNPNDLSGARVDFKIPSIKAEKVKVYIYTLPFFPLYEGRSTRFGVSFDGADPVVLENRPVEFTKEWKDDVLRNGTLFTVEFPVAKETKKHQLTLVCGDPGVVIQKIIIDWGGLKETYVGPPAR